MSQDELQRLRARVAALEAAQAAGGFYDVLARSIPDFVFFKSKDRRFVKASQAFCEMFGRPLEEIIGKRDEELFPPEVASETSIDDLLVLEGTPIIDRIEGGEVSPGVETWVSTTKLPWRDEAGEIVGLLGISRDITRSKKRFDALQEEVMRSRRLEFLGRMAGGIAHDFNNMLMVILVAAQELSAHLHDDPDYLQDAKAIEDTATNAHVLIQQLLSFSRPKSFSQRPVDPNLVLEGLRNTIMRLLPSNIELELSLGPIVAPIWIDPGQFSQIVLNLVVNARDAMNEGGVLSISTETLTGVPDHGLQVRLTVADTGMGMDEATMARIYEPFFTTKGEGRGMGLGLATVHSILQAGEHEAHIDVESRPSVGTKFRILFPTVNAPMPDDQPSNDDTCPLEGTVLLLDDHPVVRSAITKMLQRCGLAVLEAGDGQQAAALAEQRDDIDLLLSDVILRSETGPEVVERVRLTRPDLPVIYMSGFSSHVFDQRGIELGSEGLLVKPFTQTSLRRCMAPYLRA